MKKNNAPVINININEGDVFADYGFENKQYLDQSIVNTLTNLADSRPIKEGLAINFRTSENINIDKADFVDAYKNTFLSKVNKKKLEIHRCVWTGVVLALISFILISLQVFIFQNLHDIIRVASEVCSWVFAWSAIEVLTIELIQLEIDKHKLQKLLSVSIKFDQK